MKLAFDARCKKSKPSSFSRVLDLWSDALNHINMPFDLWMEGPCTADILISPNTDIAPVKGPIKVATMHDVNSLQPQRSSWIRRVPAIYSLNKVAKKLKVNADYIWTVSEFSRQSIGKAFPGLRDKIFVVPNYPNKIFCPGEADFDFLKENHIPKNCVLFVSAFRKHKNFEALWAAHQSLPEELKENHPLVCVANGEKAKKLMREKAHFTGRINDKLLLHIYRSAAIMVFPSFAEGFGLPPLEAIASGCSVLSSSTTSMPEVLGEGAIYFDPFNPSELKDLLIKNLGNQKPPSGTIKFDINQCGKAIKDFTEKISTK